ncbi:chaplin [Kitasatospora sp. NPDC004669]|uniref:chaplin n=1 Tax=Kitasatospora sp. NPDC004669 TaxID=3154555 RepID=UPI0033BAF7C3
MRIRTTLAATALAAVTLLAGAGTAAAGDAIANGQAIGSPGFLSGNLVQFPINFEGNFCGNTFSPGGIFNPAIGTLCINE